MATAVVEERQLLKSLRWWDGFAIAMCNPGFLFAGLGYWQVWHKLTAGLGTLPVASPGDNAPVAGPRPAGHHAGAVVV